MILTLLVVANLVGLWPVAPLRAVPAVPPTASEILDGLEVAGVAGDVSASSSALTSKPTDTPIPFSAVAFELPEGTQAEFRTSLDGRWGPWVEAEQAEEDEGPDPDSQEAATARARGIVSTELSWVGEADRIQVRVLGGSPADVRVMLIDSMGLSRSLFARAADAFQFGVPEARAAVMPDVVTRKEWGADEALRDGDPSYADSAFFGVVHHTVNANDYTKDEAPGIVRAIYRWHVIGNGWSDIGYNLLVDRFGTIYEGRYGGIDQPVIGAHAGGFNTGSFGIAVIGDFQETWPSTEAVSALKSAISWKYDVHDINPDANGKVVVNDRELYTLSGHGDTKSTSCPGRLLYYKLPELRDTVEAALVDWKADGWVPLTGDWDGDGLTTAGWFRNGDWRLVNDHTDWPNGAWSFRYGTAGDLPVVGDWDGDGDTDIGIVRDGTWYLRYTNDSGPADRTFRYGTAGDHPVAGDWNGDGHVTPGVVRDSYWMLRNQLGAGSADLTFRYGRAIDLPLTGDWDADGSTTVGVVRDGTWHLRNSNSKGASDVQFNYGRVSEGDVPVTGDWNGSGTTTPGIIRDVTWYLRQRNSGGTADVVLNFPPGS